MLIIICCRSFILGKVDFIEEVQAGEIPVMTFETPYDSGDGTIDTVSISGLNRAALDAFNYSDDK